MSENSPDPAPMLAYAKPAEQAGVICDLREDGVTITLPATLGSRIRVCGHPVLMLSTIVLWYVQRAMGKPIPPRLTIELNRIELKIIEQSGAEAGGYSTRAWPRDQVGEIRPNRYSKGLLVRIPGKDNFDLLGDCSQPVINAIAEALNEAIQRTAK